MFAAKIQIIFEIRKKNVSFIENRGGWNCGHELIPVNEVAVPADILQRYNKPLAWQKFDKEADVYKLMAERDKHNFSVKSFTLDENKFNEIEKSGYHIFRGYEPDIISKEDWIKAYNNGAMAKFNIPEYENTIKKIMEKQGKDVWYQEKELSYNDYNGQFEISLQGRVDGKWFSIRRKFYPSKTVEHSLFELDESLQGKGIAKELFRHLYSQYKNMGIKKIIIHANIDVGGYAWMKYGFTAKADQYDKLASFATMKAKNKYISNSNRDDFIEWLKQYKGKDIPIYKLADKEYAYGLLEHTEWNGFLDFENT
ncbi:MAG: GNAT family N-acetyltransferase [Dysgonamonadaceae bacterium]|nr:GNAT family N-acetyltransferase [Dysgonamonadaceae bacterium]